MQDNGLVHLAIDIYEVHCWSMTQESGNYNRDCACSNICSILSEGLDMVIVRTAALNGSISFWGGSGCAASFNHTLAFA